jgi:hypothetical protein
MIKCITMTRGVLAQCSTGPRLIIYSAQKLSAVVGVTFWNIYVKPTINTV